MKLSERVEVGARCGLSNRSTIPAIRVILAGAASKPAAPRKEAVTYCSCSVQSGQCCRCLRCVHTRCDMLLFLSSPARLSVSSCLLLPRRVHAHCHTALSRKPPALTDAAYALNSIPSLLLFLFPFLRAQGPSDLLSPARLFCKSHYPPAPPERIAWTNGFVDKRP